MIRHEPKFRRGIVLKMSVLKVTFLTTTTEKVAYFAPSQAHSGMFLNDHEIEPHRGLPQVSAS